MITPSASENSIQSIGMSAFFTISFLFSLRSSRMVACFVSSTSFAVVTSWSSLYLSRCDAFWFISSAFPIFCWISVVSINVPITSCACIRVSRYHSSSFSSDCILWSSCFRCSTFSFVVVILYSDWLTAWLCSNISLCFCARSSVDTLSTFSTHFMFSRLFLYSVACALAIFVFSSWRSISLSICVVSTHVIVFILS